MDNFHDDIMYEQPVVQEGERLAEALLTNHQVFLRAMNMMLILIMILNFHIMILATMIMRLLRFLSYDINDRHCPQTIRAAAELHFSGAGESGEPGGGAGGQAAPPHLGLPYHYGQVGVGDV